MKVLENKELNKIAGGILTTVEVVALLGKKGEKMDVSKISSAKVKPFL